ncbi:hypothetical protein RUND412_006734 [Rhizina undulata]
MSDPELYKNSAAPSFHSPNKHLSKNNTRIPVASSKNSKNRDQRTFNASSLPKFKPLTEDPNIAARSRPDLIRGPSGSSSSTTSLSKPIIKHYAPVQNSIARNRHGNDMERVQREPLIKQDSLREQREETIRKKLKTYEIFLALKAGYMPSTEQLTAWARYALRGSGVLDSRNRRLSPQGRVFVKDLRSWVEAVAELALSKNEDDKIQEFIWHTSHAHIMGRAPNLQGVAKPGVKSGSDAQKAFEKLRLLGNLLYSSPEFRKLLNDFLIVARDIFADAASNLAITASKAADSARPSEADLSQIDKPSSSTADASGSKKSMGSPPSAKQLSSVVKDKGMKYVDVVRTKGIESKDEVEAYLREKFPKQRTDAIINRLKNVVTDIQKNSDWQETADFLWALVGEYVQRIGKGIVEEGKKSEETVSGDEHFEVAMQDAKAILTAFAGGHSLDGINEAMKCVVEDVQNDRDLKEFYDNFITFFRRLLTEKSYVTSDTADAEAHRIYRRSQELLYEKEGRYRPDVERLFDEAKAFVDAIKNDREVQRVVETSKKVFYDLIVLDADGNFKGWRKKVLKDICDVLLPRLVGEVRYIPVPRVEYQDRDWDVILENVVLESEHFIPYRTLLEAFTKAEFINGYTFTSKYQATTRIRMENINLFAKDISFIARKKTGLVRFSDKGYFDVFMDGRGASAEIVLNAVTEDDDEEPDSYFHVRSVTVHIHHFNYNYNAYHSWAASLLSPIIRPMVKNLVARVLEQKIKEAFEQADRELYALVERMRVASIANRGGGSVESWIRAVLSRPDGDKRRREGDWKVSVGDEALFPGVYAPGSLMAELKRLRARVDDEGECESWRNNVFDVMI